MPLQQVNNTDLERSSFDHVVVKVILIVTHYYCTAERVIAIRIHSWNATGIVKQLMVWPLAYITLSSRT